MEKDKNYPVTDWSAEGKVLTLTTDGGELTVTAEQITTGTVSLMAGDGNPYARADDTGLTIVVSPGLRDQWRTSVGLTPV